MVFGPSTPDYRRVDGPDEPPFQPLRRDRKDDHLVEPGVIAERLLRADHRPTLAREAAGLPFVLGRHPVRRKEPHAPVDAQRSLPAVLDRELRILGEAEDVAVGVDDHGVAAGGRFALYA